MTLTLTLTLTTNFNFNLSIDDIVLTFIIDHFFPQRLTLVITFAIISYFLLFLQIYEHIYHILNIIYIYILRGKTVVKKPITNLIIYSVNSHEFDCIPKIRILHIANANKQHICL